MKKRAKIASSSVKSLNIIDKAKNLLDKRGVTYEYKKNRDFINIKTVNGAVAYYPLTNSYRHGVIHGYADDTESIIEYAAKQGIEKPVDTALAMAQMSNNPFIGMTHGEMLKVMPLSGLATIEFNKNDDSDEIDHKRWVYKQYSLMIRALTNLLSQEKSNFTPKYLLIKGIVNDINTENIRLKKKYPFLALRGVSLQSFILECLKEDVGEQVWKSYIARAEQKRIDVFFNGAEHE